MPQSGVEGKPYDHQKATEQTGGKMSTQMSEEAFSTLLAETGEVLRNTVIAIKQYTILTAQIKALNSQIRSTQEYQVYQTANKKFREVVKQLPEYKLKQEAFDSVKALPEYQQKQVLSKERAKMLKAIINNGSQLYEKAPEAFRTP